MKGLITFIIITLASLIAHGLALPGKLDEMSAQLIDGIDCSHVTVMLCYNKCMQTGGGSMLTMEGCFYECLETQGCPNVPSSALDDNDSQDHAIIDTNDKIAVEVVDNVIATRDIMVCQKEISTGAPVGTCNCLVWQACYRCCEDNTSDPLDAVLCTFGCAVKNSCSEERSPASYGCPNVFGPGEALLAGAMKHRL